MGAPQALGEKKVRPITAMRVAGFFEEFWPPSFGTSVGSVHDFTSSAPYEDPKEITKYLLTGHDLFSVMGSSGDVLGSGETILGGDSILSDGDWVWRGDLWFYVRKYNVRLPDPFLARVREKQYLVPAGKEIELRKLAQKVQDSLMAGKRQPPRLATRAGGKRARIEHFQKFLQSKPGS
ncbi:hypothetical protein ACFWEH_04935 [Streptomyces anulatus]|uniref:hypothetical protein n=1 Tax=Streptomyces TaxID=1883 RepID=UPI0018E923D6|nr:hypothetical protein [Streptomyces sp. TSRI0395]